MLVFEDVTMHGYGLSSGPLNVDGTKFVAGKLAKFHAASLYLDRDVNKSADMRGEHLNFVSFSGQRR